MRTLHHVQTKILGATAFWLLTLGSLETTLATPLPLNNQPVNGRLEHTDPTYGDGSYYDTYTFEATAGQQIRLTMISQDIDSYLMLFDPNMTVIAQNDDRDSSASLDAEIVITLNTGGTYTVLANSYDPGEMGTYQLQATLLNSNALTGSLSTPAQPESGFWCDTTAETPRTMARTRHGYVDVLIDWSSSWTQLEGFSAEEQCQRVSGRFQVLKERTGGLGITAGTINAQSVICIARARGQCASNGLLMTTRGASQSQQGLTAIQAALARLAEGETTAASSTLSSSAMPTLPNPVAILAPPPSVDATPIDASLIQFEFTDVLEYSNCLEDIIQLYQNRDLLRQQGRRSQCLPNVFVTYGRQGLSATQAAQLVVAADQYVLEEVTGRRLFPPAGQRRRISQMFGFTYTIDQ